VKLAVVLTCSCSAVSVMRPSIVSVAQHRPRPGWQGSKPSTVGVHYAVSALGLWHGLSYRPSVRANIVPVDFVARRLVIEALRSESAPASGDTDTMNKRGPRFRNIVASWENSVPVPLVVSQINHVCGERGRRQWLFPMMHLTNAPVRSHPSQHTRPMSRCSSHVVDVAVTAANNCDLDGASPHPTNCLLVTLTVPVTPTTRRGGLSV